MAKVVFSREIGARLLLAALLTATLLTLHHYAPLQVGSTLFWAGGVVGLAGMLCVVRPLPLLFIHTRLKALGLVAAGLVLAFSGLLLPASLEHSSGTRERLDEALSSWNLSERHEVEVPASAERVMAAAHASTFSDIPAYAVLMRLRTAAAGQWRAPQRVSERPIIETMTGPRGGFHILMEDSDREIVIGMIGRPWASEPPVAFASLSEFLSFTRPGYVKVAFNMRAEPRGANACLLTTETRVLATDDAARQTFARYWHAIYPGSGIIRRVWLNAIRDRAVGLN